MSRGRVSETKEKGDREAIVKGDVVEPSELLIVRQGGA